MEATIIFTFDGSLAPLKRISEHLLKPETRGGSTTSQSPANGDEVTESDLVDVLGAALYHLPIGLIGKVASVEAAIDGHDPIMLCDGKIPREFRTVAPLHRPGGDFRATWRGWLARRHTETFAKLSSMQLGTAADAKRISELETENAALKKAVTEVSEQLCAANVKLAASPTAPKKESTPFDYDAKATMMVKSIVSGVQQRLADDLKTMVEAMSKLQVRVSAAGARLEAIEAAATPENSKSDSSESSKSDGSDSESECECEECLRSMEPGEIAELKTKLTELGSDLSRCRRELDSASKDLKQHKTRNEILLKKLAENKADSLRALRERWDAEVEEYQDEAPTDDFLHHMYTWMVKELAHGRTVSN